MSNEELEDEDLDDNYEWIPFTKKPEHLKQPVKETNEHRRVSHIVHQSVVLEAFKKSVHKGEYSDEDLLTVYRVVATQLMRKEIDSIIIKMHDHIRAKVNEVYERRIKKARKTR